MGAANQVAQDKNASGLNSQAAAQRAVTKSCSIYGCGSWDLVDACKNEEFELEKVAVKDLPENMRKMSLDERRKFIAKSGKERDKIQAQITAVSKKRQTYVAGEMKKQALDPTKSFDHAVRTAVRSQAKAKGFHSR